LGGGLVKAEWFNRYRHSEWPARFDRIVQSWNTANKATELSDFSVCTTWGVKGKELFLLAVFRQKLEYPALKRAVREQLGLFKATVVLIEDKASGTQLIQELIKDGCHAATRYQPTTALWDLSRDIPAGAAGSWQSRRAPPYSPRLLPPA
jgi:phage terminase large subunit-like protein